MSIIDYGDEYDLLNAEHRVSVLPLSFRGSINNDRSLILPFESKN